MLSISIIFHPFNNFSYIFHIIFVLLFPPKEPPYQMLHVYRCIHIWIVYTNRAFLSICQTANTKRAPACKTIPLWVLYVRAWLYGPPLCHETEKYKPNKSNTNCESICTQRWNTRAQPNNDSRMCRQSRIYKALVYTKARPKRFSISFDGSHISHFGANEKTKLTVVMKISFSHPPTSSSRSGMDGTAEWIWWLSVDAQSPGLI